MDSISPELIWWGIAATLIVLEMLTGTFYLLVLGVAAALTGFAAWMGAPLMVQLLTAIVLLVLGLLLLRRYKAKADSANLIQNNDLEAGNWVDVIEWHEGGRAAVRYRETRWQAVLDDASDAQLGRMCIRRVQGNTLVIASQP